MAEKYENVKRPRRQIFMNNLIGGVAWGIGATIGLAIFIAVLGLIGHYINFIPIIGNFISQIIEFILTKHPQMSGGIMPFLFTQYAYA